MAVTAYQQVIDFTGDGLFGYNPNSGFTRIIALDPTSFQTDGLGDVFAVFSSGLFRKISRKHRRLDSAQPDHPLGLCRGFGR